MTLFLILMAAVGFGMNVTGLGKSMKGSRNGPNIGLLGLSIIGIAILFELARIGIDIQFMREIAYKESQR